MNDLAKAPKSVNWETVRRLRYGDVLRLIRHRYGVAGVPDDDAGNPDLFELLMLASLAPAGADKKVRNAIEVYAPWMRQDAVEALVQHLALIPNYQKLRTSEELGRAIRLKNLERERLKLWRLKPYDMNEAELEQQAKDRKTASAAERRRKQGVRSMAEYQSERRSNSQPWVKAGVSRSTWYRRVRFEDAQIIVSKREHPRVSLGEAERQIGASSEAGVAKGASEVANVESDESQREQASSDLDHPRVSLSARR
jgi:hypothetical protein